MQINIFSVPPHGYTLPRALLVPKHYLSAMQIAKGG